MLIGEDSGIDLEIEIEMNVKKKKYFVRNVRISMRAK